MPPSAPTNETSTPSQGQNQSCPHDYIIAQLFDLALGSSPSSPSSPRRSGSTIRGGASSSYLLPVRSIARPYTEPRQASSEQYCVRIWDMRQQPSHSLQIVLRTCSVGLERRGSWRLVPRRWPDEGQRRPLPASAALPWLAPVIRLLRLLR